LPPPICYLGDRFSELPSSVEQIVVLGIIASALLIPWTWWFDRHRELVTM
jgi:hypothetical protein